MCTAVFGVLVENLPPVTRLPEHLRTKSARFSLLQVATVLLACLRCDFVTSHLPGAASLQDLRSAEASRSAGAGLGPHRQRSGQQVWAQQQH